MGKAERGSSFQRAAAVCDHQQHFQKDDCKRENHRLYILTRFGKF